MSFSVTQVGIPNNSITSPKIAPNEVASEDLAVSTVQYAEVEISADELKALVAAPKTLVAAQGANTIIEFISCELAYDKGETTYTPGNATDLQVKFNTSATPVSCTRAVTGFLDQAGDKAFVLTPVGVAALDLSTSVNKALELTLASTDGEMTAGDGTVHAKVAYRVHATGL